MANLKEIRTRISSTKSTKQITSAMKMVSAAKLKKAQDAIIQMRPYAMKLQDILIHLSSGLDDLDGNVYSSGRQLEKVLLVVITANRGLCGGFNSNVVKKTVELIEGPYKAQHQAGNLDILLLFQQYYVLINIHILIHNYQAKYLVLNNIHLLL